MDIARIPEELRKELKLLERGAGKSTKPCREKPTTSRPPACLAFRNPQAYGQDRPEGPCLNPYCAGAALEAGVTASSAFRI